MESEKCTEDRGTCTVDVVRAKGGRRATTLCLRGPRRSILPNWYLMGQGESTNVVFAKAALRKRTGCSAKAQLRGHTPAFDTVDVHSTCLTVFPVLSWS